MTLKEKATLCHNVSVELSTASDSFFNLFMDIRRERITTEEDFSSALEKLSGDIFEIQKQIETIK